MAIFVPIPLYLQIAQVSQFLSQADLASQNALNGGAINNNYTRLLRAVRRAVQWAYNQNPTNIATQATAIYMYQLCGKYVGAAQAIINNQAIGLPSLTGPTNQSAIVGGNVTFSVTVSGTGPFAYQWLLSGVPIVGATSSTLPVNNAQLSQNGNVYSVAVTNPKGTVTSNVATLTVTAALVGYLYQGNTDYSIALQGGTDNVAYLGTFSIVTGQPLVVPFPNLGATEYIVVKYPSTEPTKTTYNNPPIDSSTVPGLALNVATITTWKYIFSQTGSPFGLNNSTGHVTFS